MGSNEQTPEAQLDATTAELALLRELPPLPTTIARLIQALSDETTDRHQLAAILDQCPPVAAKLVGLASSAYFRRAKRVTSVSDAIFVVGFRTVRSLVIATALQQSFARNRCPAFEPGRFWLQAVMAAHVARELARNASVTLPVNAEEAYLCGLVHGIGLMALAYVFPDDLDRLLREDNRQPGILSERIQKRFGMTHHRIGAALLRRWHLPELVACATENYANPDYQGSLWLGCRLIAIAHDWSDRVIHQGDTEHFDPQAMHLLGITADQVETTRACLDQFEDFSDLAELISGEKPVLCEPEVAADAAVELKDRLVGAIESLSSLSALSEIDVQERTEEGVLRGALKVLMANQDMQRCSVFLIEGDELYNAAGLSWSEQHITGSQPPDATARTRRFKVGEGLIGLAAQSGQIQHCRDCLVDPRFKPLPSADDSGTGSLISVPICFQQTTLGVLNISHRMPNVFNDWHERFLYVFCNLLGQLITSNRLLKTMEHAIEQRTLELQVALERAESLSILDGLTGVHNRRYFISNFSTLIEQCARYRHKLALLMIDVDNFKHINDTFGHLEGDRILKAIANILKHCARGADIIARFGGEEFVVALQDTDCDGANQVAGRILDQIRLLNCGQAERKEGITASIGVSCYTKVADMPIKTPEQWIQEADEALYRAKGSGKNRISVHVADAASERR